MSSLLDLDELGADLTAQRVEYDVFAGLDHDGMLTRLDLVLPTIAAWLFEHSSRRKWT